MNTLQKPRKARKPLARTIKVVVPLPAEGDGSAVVTITVGRQADDYLLRSIPADFGAGFTVEKVGDPDGAAYAVNVNANGTGSCECLGCLRHGHCKHVEGLAALIRAGKLPGPRPYPRSTGDLAANHPDAYADMQADDDGR